MNFGPTIRQPNIHLETASAVKFRTCKELFWKQEKKTVSSAVIVGRFMLCREAFGDIENLNVSTQNPNFLVNFVLIKVHTSGVWITIKKDII